LRRRLRELAAVRVRNGDHRLQVLLQREGRRVSHKRVDRLDREEGLAIRTKHRKKRVSVPRFTPPPA
jgi:putative transposase